MSHLIIIYNPSESLAEYLIGQFPVISQGQELIIPGDFIFDIKNLEADPEYNFKWDIINYNKKPGF